MATKVDELKKQIAQLEEKLQAIEQSEKASQEALADLESKRRGLVTAARLDKNQKAKVALDALDSDIGKARRDAEDDATVKADLLHQLESAKDGLAVAEWEAGRESVRGLVESRVKADGERRLAITLHQLTQIMQELADNDMQLADALRQFEPRRLNIEAGHLRRLCESRHGFISADLDKVGVPSQLNWKALEIYRNLDLAASALQSFDRVLEAIDQLEA